MKMIAADNCKGKDGSRTWIGAASVSAFGQVLVTVTRGTSVVHAWLPLRQARALVAQLERGIGELEKKRRRSA